MKRTVLWMLSMILVFTMIPLLGATAYAEDGNGSPAISVGAGNIEKGNKVYMGMRLLGIGPFTESPISWIVLGDPKNSKLEDGTGTEVSPNEAKLLITEKTQGDVEFNPYNQSNKWQGSNIQNWCREFITDSDGGWNPQTESLQRRDHFSENERSTMLATSKTDSEFEQWGASSLENEQLFLLSAEEVSDDYGYFRGDESRIAYKHDNDEACEWWLRSPDSQNSDHAARVMLNGNAEYYGGGACPVGVGQRARPAFNFNLNAVLFTSAAEGGKSSGTPGASALTAVSNTTSNEWKLTLIDPSRSSFTASAASGASLEQNEGYSEWAVPVVYSEANTGENEYVSVILCDSNGTAMYYGNIANNSAASSESGQAVKIPAGLTAGSYTMYVFNEQVNGDRLTDYASEFSTIKLTVKSYPPEPQKPTSIKGAKVVLSKAAFTYNAKVQKPAIRTIKGLTLKKGTDYTIKWSNTSSRNVGTYTVTVTGKGNYTGTAKATYRINKAANPLKIGPKTATVKFSKLKKANQTLAVTKVIQFTKKLGDKKTYVKASGSKMITIAKTTGKVTVKKGLKKGSYKIKVNVKAAGNTNYKASKVKTVTFKIKVK